MAQFHSFLWRLMVHCIYVPHLYPFLCWWTFSLLPCPGYCKHCCSKQWDSCIFLNYDFLHIIAQDGWLLFIESMSLLDIGLLRVFISSCVRFGRFSFKDCSVSYKWVVYSSYLLSFRCPWESVVIPSIAFLVLIIFVFPLFLSC